MKYFTVAQWVQTRDMSVGDMEECLMELEYQTMNCDGRKLRWIPTEEGAWHAKKSWNPFDQTLRWDFDAFFDVVKYYGRKTRKYFYCEECDAYLDDQYGFEADMQNWVCKKCGCVNSLGYQVSLQKKCPKYVER